MINNQEVDQEISPYSESEIVFSFKKNQQEAVVVCLSEWKNEKYFHIRIYVSTVDSDDLIPTKEGISLPLEKFSEFKEGVEKLGNVISKDVVVAFIEKNNLQQVRIGHTTFKNIPLIYVRIFQKNQSNSDFVPTKKGISLREEQYPLLYESVLELEKAIKNIKAEI